MWKILYVRPAPNRINIIRFNPKGALTTLKRVYRVKRSPYLYSVRNFPPYPIWDVTNTSLSANITFSLYPMGLWGQTDKHPPRGQTNPHTEVEDQL